MGSITTVTAGNSSFIDFTVVQNEAGDILGGDVQLNPVGDRINSAMWASGDTTLLGNEMHTSSLQMTASGEYYLDVYRSDPIADPTQVAQFSVAYGNYFGYGETGLEGQSDMMTPTKAIYSQYAALLEDKNSTDADFKFNISGSARDSIYVINIGRNQLKERADSGNWELKISGSLGITTFVDQYVGSGSNDLGDGPVPIVEGSISAGITAAPTYTEYGKFYPNYGVMVFDAENVDAKTGMAADSLKYSYDGATANYTQSITMRKTNPYSFYTGLVGGNHFKARSTEHLHTRTYFCRIPSYAANFSSNPTFVKTTSQDGSFLYPSMIGNPKSYITTVGLYDEQHELLAVAKLSKPLLKSFNREALVRVRLEY
tara:strand:- start:46 stop:1161 length:1116 start_codon:yes stop_codon:yes gene_type:complete